MPTNVRCYLVFVHTCFVSNSFSNKTCIICTRERVLHTRTHVYAAFTADNIVEKPFFVYQNLSVRWLDRSFALTCMPSVCCCVLFQQRNHFVTLWGLKRYIHRNSYTLACHCSNIRSARKSTYANEKHSDRGCEQNKHPMYERTSEWYKTHKFNNDENV